MPPLAHDALGELWVESFCYDWLIDRVTGTNRISDNRMIRSRVLRDSLLIPADKLSDRSTANHASLIMLLLDSHDGRRQVVPLSSINQ